MSFNSFEFLIFLPIVVGLYWIFPQKIRWILLLAASYYFYMSWNYRLVFLILIVTLVSYLAGFMVRRTKNPTLKTLWLVITIIICIGMLVFFKYFNFLSGNAVSVLNFFGVKSDVIFMNIILPVGISFYTFQAISYVIDVYRGTIEPEFHFGYYALFISFFPQLVAGPIERPQNLIPQLKKEHFINSEDIQEGIRLLSCGFFRKVVIADFVGTFVSSVYSNHVQVDGGAVFIATLLFSVQIYCDFLGYTEIASGCARLMGIHLMKNFNRPYFAKGIRDFWGRWHISLTSWFTDYIYISMGGSRHGVKRRIFAICVVFFISGLWHGAAWTFVVWGMIHAIYLIVEILIQKPLIELSKHFSRDNNGKIRNLLAVVGTFCLVNFAWIFFRSETLGQAFYFIRKLFAPWDLISTVTDLNIQIIDGIQLLMIITMLPVLYYFKEVPIVKDEVEIKMNAKAVLYVYFIMAIALSWLIRLEQNGANTFIYFQF